MGELLQSTYCYKKRSRNRRSLDSCLKGLYETTSTGMCIFNHLFLYLMRTLGKQSIWVLFNFPLGHLNKINLTLENFKKSRNPSCLVRSTLWLGKQIMWKPLAPAFDSRWELYLSSSLGNNIKLGRRKVNEKCYCGGRKLSSSWLWH